jgi:site-specific recombinase XerD
MARHHRQAVAIPAAIQQAMTGFRQYLAAERRLSRATLTVYGRDVQHFFLWQQQQGQEVHLDLLTKPAVLQFLEARLHQGLSVSSIKRILPGLRAFDRYLKLEGLRPTLMLVDMETPEHPAPSPVPSHSRTLRSCWSNPLGLR